MKKFFALGTFLTLVSPVNAGGFYATLSGGIALPETVDLIEIGGKNEKDTLPVGEAFSGELGIGYDFENTIRTDITYSNANHDVNFPGVNGEIEINNISVNIYKDFKFDNSKFTP